MRHTSQRCAEVQRLHPGRGRLDAVVLDHWDEVVVFRVAAGALGLLLLGALAVAYARSAVRVVLEKSTM